MTPAAFQPLCAPRLHTKLGLASLLCLSSCLLRVLTNMGDCCRSFEMALAACASPLVGFLAERVFGFKGPASAGAGGASSQGEDLAKAKALGNALLVCLVVPWAICLIVYTGQPGCSQVLSSLVCSDHCIFCSVQITVRFQALSWSVS